MSQRVQHAPTCSPPVFLCGSSRGWYLAAYTQLLAETYYVACHLVASIVTGTIGLHAHCTRMKYAMLFTLFVQVQPYVLVLPTQLHLCLW